MIDEPYREKIIKACKNYPHIIYDPNESIIKLNDAIESGIIIFHADKLQFISDEQIAIQVLNILCDISTRKMWRSLREIGREIKRVENL